MRASCSSWRPHSSKLPTADDTGVLKSQVPTTGCQRATQLRRQQKPSGVYEFFKGDIRDSSYFNGLMKEQQDLPKPDPRSHFFSFFKAGQACKGTLLVLEISHFSTES